MGPAARGTWEKEVILRTGADFAKKYLASIGLLICLVVLSVFWGFYYRSTELIEKQLLYQGNSFFQEIVLTRQWIASMTASMCASYPVSNPTLIC